MVNLIKKTFHKTLVARNNYISNGIAKDILCGLEQEYGKLSKKHKKLCNDYAIDVLKSNTYAPWLWVYAHVAGDFKEGWIPDNYYRNVLVPKIQGKYGKVSFLKTLNDRVLKEDLELDLLFSVNDIFSTPKGTIVSANQAIATIFENNSKVIFKPDSSAQGKGIRILNVNKKTNIDIHILGNGVFQKVIEQHDFFNQFTKDVVATVRLTTVLDLSGQVNVVAAYVRIGRSGEIVVASSSHIRVPINLKDGSFSNYGYDIKWKKLSFHPDSNIPFNGQTIPYFHRMLKKVKKLHKSYPYVRVIGWDLVVDKDDNLCIMEWNGYGNDIKFSEATQGPCLKSLNVF